MTRARLVLIWTHLLILVGALAVIQPFHPPARWVPESTCGVQYVHYPMHKIQPPMLDWNPRGA